jgi:xanthine dehydrogenase accessory factor
MYRKLRQAIQEGTSAVLATLIEADGELRHLVGQKLLFDGTGSFGPLRDASLAPEIELRSRQALQQREARLYTVSTASGPAGVFIEPCHPVPSLFVLGGGHISRALVSIAAQLEYEITVIDDRPSFAGKEQFPQAHSVVCGDFPRSLQKQRIDAGSSVVIATRGHQHDLDCLEQVLKTRPGYVGVVASRRRAGLVREHLLGLGYPKERVDQVQMPVGLNIGAETPQEIALSIAAELVQVRHGLTGRPVSLFSAGEQHGLLAQMVDLLEQGQPFVAAVVVRTSGSTPRKAGARMLLLPDGRSAGTVGGGCGEAAVRSEARMLFDTGGARLIQVGMDAEIATDEGMACGGSMDVFLEKVERPASTA